MSIPTIDTVLFIRQTIVNTRNALQREDDRRTSLQEQGKEKVYSDISNDDGQINCHIYYPNSEIDHSEKHTPIVFDDNRTTSTPNLYSDTESDGNTNSMIDYQDILMDNISTDAQTYTTTINSICSTIMKTTSEYTLSDDDTKSASSKI
jgi:hypothetical protein